MKTGRTWGQPACFLIILATKRGNTRAVAMFSCSAVNAWYGTDGYSGLRTINPICHAEPPLTPNHR